MNLSSVVALGGILLCSTTLALADGANSDEQARLKDTSRQESERLKGLFADLPDYAAAAPMAPGMKTPPRLIAGAPPASPDFLEPGKKVTVMVAIAISEQGDVAAARVFKSDDARCDSLSVDAISKWKFAPATNGTAPIKCVVQIPLQFVTRSADDQRLGVEIGALAYDVRYSSLHAPVHLKGPYVTQIKGTRLTVTSAIDDTGTELGGGSPGSFFRAAVGMVSEDVLVATKVPMPSISLRAPAKSATQLRLLEGTLEMVVPGKDPMATAHLSQLSGKLGVPVVSPELAAAKVTITVFDKTTCTSALADLSDPAKLRELLLDSPFASMPGWKPPVSTDGMTDTDVAVAIDDPEGRLVGLEFQTLYGSPVTYNHNGWLHFEKSAGKRFSIYRLRSKLTDDIKLVCWLATARSTVTQSFHLTNLPLPAPPKS